MTIAACIKQHYRGISFRILDIIAFEKPAGHDYASQTGGFPIFSNMKSIKTRTLAVSTFDFG